MSNSSFLKQPESVWAVAFACVIAFMGIGLVDPILKPIAEQLHATPSQVSLLFTSYMAVIGVAMLITGAVSSRIGAKRTLLIGLAIIVVFSALAGLSNSIGMIVAFRAGWGLGNALFIATALATIVDSASGSVAQAIILYEAALGVGIAAGPLVGGELGTISLARPVLRGRRPDDDRARRDRVPAPRSPPEHAVRRSPTAEGAPAPVAGHRRDHRAALQLRLLHPARRSPRSRWRCRRARSG